MRIMDRLAVVLAVGFGLWNGMALAQTPSAPGQETAVSYCLGNFQATNAVRGSLSDRGGAIFLKMANFLDAHGGLSGRDRVEAYGRGKSEGVAWLRLSDACEAECRSNGVAAGGMDQCALACIGRSVPQGISQEMVRCGMIIQGLMMQ